MSCIELHELAANKPVAKTYKFQFYMHPVTTSLLNSVGGAGSVGWWCESIKFWHGSKKLFGWRGWHRSIKFGVGKKNSWVKNLTHDTHATHAPKASYQTPLQQIKSQAVLNNPLVRKSIFKTIFSIFTKIIS